MDPRYTMIEVGNSTRSAGSIPPRRVRQDLYRKRFLWRLAFIRFLRLCLLILVLRRFFREPMVCSG